MQKPIVILVQMLKQQQLRMFLKVQMQQRQVQPQAQITLHKQQVKRGENKHEFI